MEVIEAKPDKGTPDEALEVMAEAEQAYNERFRALLADNPGMNEEGAKRHLEMLSNIPRGYGYYGTWPDEDTSKMLSVPPPPPNTEKWDYPVYDITGEPLEGYVHLIVHTLPDEVGAS